VAVSRAKLALGVPLATAADVVLFSMLRRAGPRPIGFTAVPPLKPAMLSSAGFESGRGCASVVLSYGRPLTVTGPLTVVETCFSEADCYLPALEEAIRRAELRDEAWSREDWEAEPAVFDAGPEEVQVQAEGFDHHDRAVLVAGQERRVTVTSHGSYEALRFTHGRLVVTAVARLGFVERAAFDVIEDLEPYLAEHRRFILSWLRFWES
jgi:hypothetical protein